VSDVDYNVRITGSDETKAAFESAAKNAVEASKVMTEDFKKLSDAVEKQTQQITKLAKRASGQTPEDLAGAFGKAGESVIGFSEGMTKALSVGAVTAFAVAAVNEFAKVEAAQNRVLATGQANRKELEELNEVWERKLAPTIGKGIEEINKDYAILLAGNAKLKDHFEEIEQYAKITRSTFQDSFNMVSTATYGGLKPEDIPSFLADLANAYRENGNAATVAHDNASKALKELGITGGEFQKQLGEAIANLGNVTNSSTTAAEQITAVLKEIALHKGESGMMRMIDQLKDGNINLNQFLDMLTMKNHPDSRNFQRMMENDAPLRTFATNWAEVIKNGPGQFHDDLRKLSEDPALVGKTEQEINRLGTAISAFGTTIISLTPANTIIGGLADALNRLNDAVKSLKSASPASVIRGITGDIVIGPKTPQDQPKGGPGSRSVRHRGGIFEKPVTTPQRFGGSAPVFSGKSSFDLSSWPKSTNIEDRRGEVYPGGGEAGGSVNPQYFTGSGGSDNTVMASLQAANEDEVHAMAMRGYGDRGAAFTPGAGESPWSLEAQVEGWGFGTGRGGGGAGYGYGGFRRGIGAAGRRGRGGSGPGGSGPGGSVDSSGPGGSVQQTAPWPTGAGVSGGKMMQTPWGPMPTGSGPGGAGTLPWPGTGGGFEGKNVQSIVADEWRKVGMSDAGIRGVLANIKEESSFDPTLRHADQPRFSGEAHFAHGLYQEGGDEWNNYAKWLNGRDWRDPRLQSQFAAENLKKNYPKVWAQMNQSDAQQAAAAYVRGYLKPKAEYQASRVAGFQRRGIPTLDQFGVGKATASTGAAPSVSGGGGMVQTPWGAMPSGTSHAGIASGGDGGGGGGGGGVAGSARLSAVENYAGGNDPNRGALLAAAREASKYLPEGYTVEAYSGQRSGKDQGPHLSGSAIDFRIRDPQGRMLANYQDPTQYRMYEQFHQDIHSVLQQTNPALAARHRWGGYFLHGSNNYGVMDTMHSDLAGPGRMAAGSWEQGRTAGGSFYSPKRGVTVNWNEAQSRGMGKGYRRGDYPRGSQPSVATPAAAPYMPEMLDADRQRNMPPKDDDYDPLGGAIPDKYNRLGGKDHSELENIRRQRAELSRPIKTTMNVTHPRQHSKAEPPERHESRINSIAQSRLDRGRSASDIGYA
jgi:hypothetical protein